MFEKNVEHHKLGEPDDINLFWLSVYTVTRTFISNGPYGKGGTSL